jgi:hypothetical protein
LTGGDGERGRRPDIGGERHNLEEKHEDEHTQKSFDSSTLEDVAR